MAFEQMQKKKKIYPSIHKSICAEILDASSEYCQIQRWNSCECLKHILKTQN